MIDILFPKERKKIESFKIETPMGSLESDSGNHIVDVISVVGVILVLYIAKRLFAGGFGKYFK